MCLEFSTLQSPRSSAVLEDGKSQLQISKSWHFGNLDELTFKARQGSFINSLVLVMLLLTNCIPPNDKHIEDTGTTLFE